MAITLFGFTPNPADTGTLDANPPPTMTPPANMVANDYVVVFMTAKTTGVVNTVSNTGGQTWTSETTVETNGMNSRVFHCRFNGTWSADPTFACSNVNAGVSLVMLVFRGVDTTTALDVAVAGQGYSATGSCTIASFDTNSNGAMAVGLMDSTDDNAWSLSTSGWDSGFARNGIGTDLSIAWVYKAIAAAGATGDVTMTQTTVQPDAGTQQWLALKAAPAVGGSQSVVIG